MTEQQIDNPRNRINPNIKIDKGIDLTLYPQADRAFLKLPRVRIPGRWRIDQNTFVDVGVLSIAFHEYSNGVYIEGLPINDEIKRTLVMVFSQIGIPIRAARAETVDTQSIKALEIHSDLLRT